MVDFGGESDACQQVRPKSSQNQTAEVFQLADVKLHVARCVISDSITVDRVRYMSIVTEYVRC